ncbi:hypothetical protein BDV10DRAFT_22697 [Aspergillus recurvatus]
MYNMDKKGFMIEVLQKGKRIFSGTDITKTTISSRFHHRFNLKFPTTEGATVPCLRR